MIEEKLIFFDKEGNQINTKWNTETQVWEADLIFSENSSDTFRTYGLYSFEKIDAFNYLSDNFLNFIFLVFPTKRLNRKKEIFSDLF